MTDHTLVSSKILQRDGFAITLPSRDLLPVASAALGTIANIVSPPIALPDRQDARIRRFFLQSVARSLMPHERVDKCLRAVLPMRSTVDVMYSPTVKAAHFKGLQTCGSVWMCPVCAAKITERRRADLQAAIDASAYRVVMITYTLRHHGGYTLKASLDGLTEAYRALRQGKAWLTLSKRFKWVGSIRSIEITHGAVNGWHPHIHELVFLPTGTSDREVGLLRGRLAKRWRSVLARGGFNASLSHGVDVTDTDEQVGDYVAKWGAAAELTKLPMKIAKGENLSPMQLLVLASEDDRPAARLWQEYAKTCKGRHQLQWSTGLRELLALPDDKTDEQLALEAREDSYLLASLSLEQWRVVNGNDIRAELLNVANSGDPIRLQRWLVGLGIYLNV